MVDFVMQLLEPPLTFGHVEPHPAQHSPQIPKRHWPSMHVKITHLGRDRHPIAEAHPVCPHAVHDGLVAVAVEDCSIGSFGGVDVLTQKLVVRDGAAEAPEIEVYLAVHDMEFDVRFCCEEGLVLRCGVGLQEGVVGDETGG